jgi:hypothetical protein
MPKGLFALMIALLMTSTVLAQDSLVTVTPIGETVESPR